MEDSVEPSSKTSSFGEQLDTLCEYYMSIGVPYEEFWFGDYCKLKYYEKQYYNAQKQKNYEMWTLGLYFYKAFDAVIMKRFVGSKDINYPSAPFGEEEPERKRTPEELQADIMAQLQATIPKQQKG